MKTTNDELEARRQKEASSTTRRLREAAQLRPDLLRVMTALTAIVAQFPAFETLSLSQLNEERRHYADVVKAIDDEIAKRIG